MFLDSLSEFWLWQLLGRLHPLVVHFPIALLLTAFFLELLTFRGKRTELRPGIQWLVFLGAAGGVAAMLFGWLLAYGGNYADETLLYHQIAGSFTALLAVLAAILLSRAVRIESASHLKMYRAALSLNVVVLIVAGHLGASLSHGSDYLTAALPWNYQPPGQASALLAELTPVAQRASISSDQLDRLNIEVRAIFAHSCYRCHSSDKMEGELRLDRREGVMAGGQNGPILIAGRPEESELMRRLLLPRGHEDAMPKEGRGLRNEEISLIKFWIEQGAHWTDDDVRTFREAELALRKPPLPPGNGRFSMPVDRFVNQYFSEQGMRWAEPVDDLTFVRRVYLDIVGLLPDPEHVEAFVADTRRDKRDRLVDDLLNRHDDYAQHWLSFWNDLLRNDYAGTGFITGGRRQITSWLYAALRENMSYDDMVRDLVNPGPDSDGFIRGIQWRGDVNSSQRTEMQAAQNVSQSLLGLNLKCASCHNSFVSNLTLNEAYSFAAVFADTLLEIHRCDIPTGDVADAGFIYEELGDIDGSLSKEERMQRLAEMLTDRQNGRLYRTIVNRLWARLMGKGLVEPVDEMDNEPWHQDLLDWLAADLIDNAHDLKHILASIMKSDAYQLPSVGIPGDESVFSFRGPLRRRLSAEQFADALSQLATPVYHAVAYDPFDSGAQAEWIWYDARVDGRQGLPPPGTYYFRHAFELPSNREVVEANLLLSVDHSFHLFLNGEKAGEGQDWREVQRLEVSHLLKTGENMLAIEGTNAGSIPNPAGVLLNLKITFTDGTETQVTSNRRWRVTDQEPGPGWESPDFDDSGWGVPRGFGSNAGNRFWGRLVAFNHASDGHPLRFARASLVQNDPFLKALGRPVREIVTTSRTSEATLLQALELTNGAFLNEALARGARFWVDSHSDPGELVEKVYHTAFSRPPTPREKAAAMDLIGMRPEVQEVQDFLWAIVMTPEFQLIY